MKNKDEQQRVAKDRPCDFSHLVRSGSNDVKPFSSILLLRNRDKGLISL